MVQISHGIAPLIKKKSGSTTAQTINMNYEKIFIEISFIGTHNS
jgi:hypothetical protein